MVSNRSGDYRNGRFEFVPILHCRMVHWTSVSQVLLTVCRDYYWCHLYTTYCLLKRSTCKDNTGYCVYTTYKILL